MYLCLIMYEWVFIDFLRILLYLSEHIYGRYIYSIVMLVNAHSMKFTPGYESSSLLETCSYTLSLQA